MIFYCFTITINSKMSRYTDLLKKVKETNILEGLIDTIIESLSFTTTLSIPPINLEVDDRWHTVNSNNHFIFYDDGEDKLSVIKYFFDNKWMPTKEDINKLLNVIEDYECKSIGVTYFFKCCIDYKYAFTLDELFSICKFVDIRNLIINNNIKVTKQIFLKSLPTLIPFEYVTDPFDQEICDRIFRLYMCYSSVDIDILKNSSIVPSNDVIIQMFRDNEETFISSLMELTKNIPNYVKIFTPELCNKLKSLEYNINFKVTEHETTFKIDIFSLDFFIVSWHIDKI